MLLVKNYYRRRSSYLVDRRFCVYPVDVGRRFLPGWLEVLCLSGRCRFLPGWLEVLCLSGRCRSHYPLELHWTLLAGNYPDPGQNNYNSDVANFCAFYAINCKVLNSRYSMQFLYLEIYNNYNKVTIFLNPITVKTGPRKLYVFMERQPTEIIGLRSLSYLGVFVDDVFLKNDSLQLVKF